MNSVQQITAWLAIQGIKPKQVAFIRGVYVLYFSEQIPLAAFNGKPVWQRIRT